MTVRLFRPYSVVEVNHSIFAFWFRHNSYFGLILWHFPVAILD
jgi:hypothetical protein